MPKLSLNSVNSDIFNVSAASQGGSLARADIVAEGRVLAYEFARRGKVAFDSAMGRANAGLPEQVTAQQYKSLNETFQKEHMLYAAERACSLTGKEAPQTFEEFKRQAQDFYGDANFMNTLAAIYTDIVTPIIPAVYSEAVSVFADVVEVGFGETATISVGSNDIPVFQDTSWGASRSVPRNRLYSKDFTLNPAPKSCWVTAKWHQLVGNGMDFGRFFANIVAGMYAKTMAMWNKALVAASAENSPYIPSGLQFTFSTNNWMILANKLAAVNNTRIGNIIAFGNAVGLSKVLPTEVTGSTNVNMDAAIATMLGADYIRSGYLGEYMGVRLMPMTDAIVPGTQNDDVKTILDPTKIWMLSANGRKPMTIAYNSATPIKIEMKANKTPDFEVGINLTIALDSVATFSSKVGLINLA